MNERIAAFADMLNEIGYSESEIAKLVEVANQEQQKQEQLKIEAEMPQNGASGEPPCKQEAITNQHQQSPAQSKEVPNRYDEVQTGPEIIRPICNHLFAATTYRAAHRCGSPALRDEAFCYYHHPSRAAKPPRRVPVGPVSGAKRRRIDRFPPFEIPALVDYPSIQVALSLVCSAIAGKRISVRQAGRLLFLLQLASCNLTNLPGLPTEARQSGTIAVPDRPFKY